MKLSIDSFELVKKFGEEQALRMIRAAGFDCVDYSFYWLPEGLNEEVFGENYIDHAKRTRSLLDEIGLSCNQAHAPLGFYSFAGSMDMSDANYAGIVKSIEIASILGAENIVIHPVDPLEGETLLETNYKFYRGFLPYCEKFNIHIAIENLFCNPYDLETKTYLGNFFGRPKAMREIIEKLDSEWFVCCIDVGHAAITGIEPDEFISGMDNKTLKVLHLHDNDYEQDRHMLPFTGKINWDRVAKSLKEINYDGELTFEIFRFMEGFDGALIEDVLRLAERVGRHLIEKIEL